MKKSWFGDDYQKNISYVNEKLLFEAKNKIEENCFELKKDEPSTSWSPLKNQPKCQSKS